MKVKDYSYETFPRYTVNIDGALELKGNKENLRCRMKDVEYQKGCMIRFLFPNTILDEERKYPLVIHVQGSGWYKQDMNDHIFDFTDEIEDTNILLPTQRNITATFFENRTEKFNTMDALYRHCVAILK